MATYRRAPAIVTAFTITSARALSAFAQELDSTNDDEKKIESASSFDELESAVTPERAPAAPASARVQADLSAILDVAGAYFSDEEPLQTGAHDPDHTGANFQGLEVSLRGAVDPYFRFDSNLVFSPFGVEVEEAYATTLGLPAGLQVRFGQFLTRFGRFNPTHPHAWSFVDQPFEIGRIFGAEGSRGLGLEISALLPLPWSVEVVASVTEARGEESARSFYGGNDLGVEALDDLLYVAALKQFFPLSEDVSLAFGLSGAFGPNSTGRDNHTDVYGADLYLKYRPLDRPAPPVLALHSEWFYRRRQVPDDLLQDFGGFAELSLRFAERWSVAGRHEYGSPSYGEGGGVAIDPLDPEWTRVRHRLAANVTFHPSEFSRLRLQGGWDEPRWRSGYYTVFLAAEVVVGAHGAHTF